jgi:ribose-phosphate pyrophosphokinase
VASAIIGDVAGKTVLMMDDMISTAGTVSEAARLVRKQGAKAVLIGATHPVLAGPAVERLCSDEIDAVVVTDTIPIDQAKRDKLGDKLTVLSVADLLGEAIRRIHTNQSISMLFSK